ncbi:MAG: hypothetical protein ACRERD_08885 [Candidatus Binatia bacterium]
MPQPKLKIAFDELMKMMLEVQRGAAAQAQPPRQTGGKLVAVPQPPIASPAWARRDDPVRRVLEHVYDVARPPMLQEAMEDAILREHQKSLAQTREAQSRPGSASPSFGIQWTQERDSWKDPTPRHIGPFVIQQNASRPLLPLPPDPSQPPAPLSTDWYATQPSRPLLPGKLPPVLPDPSVPYLPPELPLPRPYLLPLPPEEWQLHDPPAQPHFPPVPSQEIRLPASPAPQTRPMRVLTPWDRWFLEVVPHSGGVAVSAGKRF